MRRLATSLLAIAVALGATAPTADALKIKAPKFVRDAVEDVKNVVRPKPAPISPPGRVAPLPSPRPVLPPIKHDPVDLIIDEAVDLGSDAGKKFIKFSEDLTAFRARANAAAGQAIHSIATDPKGAWDAVKDTTGEAWDGITETADLLFSMSPEERLAIARTAYEAVEPLIPVVSSFARGIENREDGKALIKAIRDGDTEKAARLLPTLSGYDEVLAAADAYGFETVSIGFGGDGSLGVGFVGEIGIAVDVKNALDNRPEDGMRTYMTYGVTAGLSGGGAGTVGVGLWQVSPGQIASDSWGVVGAAASGPAGGSAGLWFAPDTERFAGVGDLAGLTIGGSVGLSLEVGELNYTRTRLIQL